MNEDQAILLEVKLDSRTEGGIIIPEKAMQADSIYFKVVNTNIEDLRVGDIVVYRPTINMHGNIRIDGVQYKIAGKKEITAICE